MDRGQLLSLKRRIGAAQSFALTELTEEVAALSRPIAGDLVDAITERIEQGACVTTGAAALLVAATRNRRLYTAAREGIIKDTGALITLLGANIPDPAIETRLRDELYRVFRSRDNPWRSQILGALAEYGSTDCLEVLEAIDYEFTPRLQTARLATELRGADRVGPRDGGEVLLQAITQAADIQFGEKVREAIARVRARGKVPTGDWSTPPPGNDPFGLARSHIARAEQQVAAEDYGAALNHCRKALEAALKSVIRRRDLKVDKKGSVDELQLPTLMGVVIPQLNLPKDICAKIEAVQKDSTYGSHDQGVLPEEILTAAMAQAAIDKYRHVEAHLAKVLSEVAPS